MKQYKWQARKRGNDYVPPLLTQKDEFVPESHIGLYDFFSGSLDESFLVSEEEIQGMRSKTYESVFSLYQKYGSNNYPLFFNYHVREIGALGINFFATHPKFAPISDLVECFGKLYRLKSNGRKRLAISFGIRKIHFIEYLDSLEEQKRTGKALVVPEANSVREVDKDILLFGKEEFTENNRSFSVGRGPVFNQFRHFCDLHDLSLTEGTRRAMLYYMRHAKTQDLLDLSEYRVETEFDHTILVKNAEQDFNQVRKTILVNRYVYYLALDIIRRYNLDTANVCKKTVTFDDYVSNALSYFNSSMPAKYSDPDAYEIEQETNEMG